MGVALIFITSVTVQVYTAYHAVKAKTSARWADKWRRYALYHLVQDFARHLIMAPVRP